MNVPLDEVIYFDAITTHPSTGAATDADSTPTFEVFEEATDTDIGVGGNLTKRTSKTGNYRGSFTVSAASLFDIGKWYSVIGSATVNSIAGKAVLMRFRVVAAEAIAGKPKVDVDAWLGTAAETPDTAGVPNVNMVYLNNSATTVDNIGNVFGTDFATNYDDTNNRWLVDVRRLGGTAVSANSAANWHTLYENDAQVSSTELSDIASATKMKVYFGLALRKDAAIASDRATELAEINFNWGTGAGAYVSTTDANEALRDRGDAAWITATGFSTLDAAGVRTAVGLASANLDTQIGTLATAANLSTVAGYLDTEIAAILADTNELQTDWANGGRLDLLVDAILDDTGTSGVAIATATMQSIADETLKRGVSSVEDTANTTSLAAIILAILESSVSGTMWTIRKTGGTTFVTKTITTDAGADPITGVT